jgi:hypothetical protein
LRNTRREIIKNKVYTATTSRLKITDKFGDAGIYEDNITTDIREMQFEAKE